MAQNYADDTYGDTHSYSTDLAQIENNFAAIKSTFSGASAPSNAVAGMLWMRTGGTGDGLRVRDTANNAWHKVLTGSAALKIWAYINAVDEGWKIDATITDRVIALKGGSNAWNVNGGTLAGTHTQPNHDHGGATDVDTSTLQDQGSGSNTNTPRHDHDINGDATAATWRMAAAVGIMIYPDLT